MTDDARTVVDTYFTAYFNAWLDNHNLYTGPKKVVTGFVPRLTLDLVPIERFFDDYPDGTPSQKFMDLSIRRAQAIADYLVGKLAEKRASAGLCHSSRAFYRLRCEVVARFGTERV